MYALVVTLKTGTPTLTLTAAVPAKPPPTAIEVSDSLEAGVDGGIAAERRVHGSGEPRLGVLVHDLDVDAGADAGGAADRETRRRC